jgi:membrane protein DedA with SNARE-associated domain
LASNQAVEAELFDWLAGVISDGGYLGIVLLMLVENLFPPIPSELIMPLAGFVAAQGKLNVGLVVLAGSLGSILGALPWYCAGRWVGEERVRAFVARHGGWLTLDEKDIGKAIDWFEAHGRMAVLLGRLVPTVRTLISLPAGMARMPLLPFLIYSAIGTALWTGLLAASGFWLQENYTVVADSIDRISKAIIVLIVLIYVWRLLAGGRLGDWVRDWAEALRRDVYAVYLAARDPRVPWYAKAFVLMIAAYVVSPIDLVPDFIPVLGQVDDAILVPLGILVATKLMPPAVLDEHRRRATILAEAPTDWRVGAAVIVFWALAAALVARWVIVVLTAT